MPFPDFSAKNPVLALAPMDSYTDAPFRQLVRLANPRTVVFTELTSATAIKFGSEKSRRRTVFAEVERPLVVQLFGKVPDDFVTAVRALDPAPDGIDINFGCPAKKVVNSGHGSALIDKPDLAADLVRAVRENFSGKVSIKTRLGIREKGEARPLLEKVCAAGVDFVSIHGRTRAEAFGGMADWAAIREIARGLPVPVIGNGDLRDAADADKRAREFSLGGGMIGRAAFGAPWIFAENGSEGGTRLSPGFPPSDAAAGAAAASPLRGAARAEETPATRGADRASGADFSAEILDGPAADPFSKISWEPGAVRATFAGEDFFLKNPPADFAEKCPWIRLHARLSAHFWGEKKGIRDLRKHLVAYVRGVPGAARIRDRLVRVETIAEVDGILAEIG